MNQPIGNPPSCVIATVTSAASAGTRNDRRTTTDSLGPQKNAERNGGVVGPGIVATAMFVSQVDGQVVFPLRDNTSATRQTQVHTVCDATSFRGSPESGD